MSDSYSLLLSEVAQRYERTDKYNVFNDNWVWTLNLLLAAHDAHAAGLFQ